MAVAFTGGGGQDAFDFVGGGAGNTFGNITLNEPAGAADNATLDFSNYHGGSINLNLAKAGLQQLTPGLGLTLPGALSIATVVGTGGNDAIVASNPSQSIQVAATDSTDPYAQSAVAPSNPQTQWVYLDFTTYQTPPSTEVDYTINVTVRADRRHFRAGLQRAGHQRGDNGPHPLRRHRVGDPGSPGRAT